VTIRVTRSDTDPTVPRPTPSIRPRADALTDAGMVRHVDGAAVKENAFASYAGHPSGMSNLQTRLRVEAWVRNDHYAKAVWIDVHVLARGADVVHGATVPLRHTRAAGDGGDLFVFDATLYHGSVATQGSVEPRPDARVVEYRLYCEQGDRVFTDGITHRCELRTEMVSG
jgi:hypothetical protein